jgi:hypothetical protein
MKHPLAALPLTLLVACGSSSATPPDASDPSSIPFGTTAIVVVVNPTINTANARSIAMPGGARPGVTVTSDDHVVATTDATGVAVLAPVTAGNRTLTISGGGATGTISVMIASGALLELAVASDPNGAQTMVQVDYKTDQAVHVSPTMTNADVNNLLKTSDQVVFFAGGHYTGDLDFSGSRVTLFGEGLLGGKVFLDGNVTSSGSNNRIRGSHITGNLTIPASGVGLTFSRVDGTTTSMGSDGMLLANAMCGTETVTGSGTLVVGNAGMAPITACP